MKTVVHHSNYSVEFLSISWTKQMAGVVQSTFPTRLNWIYELLSRSSWWLTLSSDTSSTVPTANVERVVYILYVFLQPGYSEESGPICLKCTMTKAPGWVTIAAGPEVTDDCYMKLLFSGEDDDVDSDDEDDRHGVLWDREFSTSCDEDSLSDRESDYWSNVVWLATENKS